ncbi:diaminopimelate epimerase [Winogradskyella eckloniae]|uniref:diaminopimelate epimerase n=1 Tax=Winogradskyella eckloniae TaxID=1089306 RepID=UPI001562F78B|nr:diaminopimelate epimerase [Winogradskyella eckloniae]NRD21125.1 diaminopimelate epimerase [Winogradskyella eckloniae]
MNMTFYKYQGTGNDFVIVDNRLNTIDKSNTKRIAEICDRRFGVGADGFILLENDDKTDFRMVYYNADGNESTMCGNGGRCIVAFAKFLGLIENDTEFVAIDGLHLAKVDDGIVHLQMQNVSTIELHQNHQFLDTGSPHHIEQVSNISNVEVQSTGAKIRYGEPYNEAGSNVNFVEQITTDSFAVRTYERGVEDETLSCGTGVTAVAIAMHKIGKVNGQKVSLKTQGGWLNVRFNAEDDGYNDIWLIGPAEQVFKGELEW